MELSAEVQDLLQRFRTLNKSHEEDKKTDFPLKSTSSYEMHTSRIQDEVLNLDDINFNNDEYWLYATASARSCSVQSWLYDSPNKKLTDSCVNVNLHQRIATMGDLSEGALGAKKIFDSRTYTRPKKKFVRPSIERYRNDCVERGMMSKSTERGVACKPLHFDLTQPMNCSRMFDNIANNAPENDSFQNMSPPSLINSMCSSTFTAAMDSSIIKNDPVLREIRVADYKAEPLMLQSLQSLTESYSSINSDSAENYLRRTLPQLLSAKTDSSECDENFYSLTGSQTLLDDNDDIDINNLNDRNLDEFYYDSTTQTAFNNNTANINPPNLTHALNSQIINRETKPLPTNTLTGDNKLDYATIPHHDNNKSHSQRNQTLFLAQQHKSHDATFNKRTQIARDVTFNKSSGDRTIAANETFAKSRPETGDYYNTGVLKRDKDRSKTRVIDASALRDLRDAKYGNGSGDSLDRISVCSGSSRGSVGKMTVADIDAIVEQQEQSLLMSTPKPSKSMSKLFDQRVILPSPIHRTLHGNKEHLSDSELSEEYATGRAFAKNKRLSMHFDNKTPSSTINTANNLNRTFKSMSNLKQPSTNARSGASLAVVKPTPSTANYGTYRKPNTTLTHIKAPATLSANYVRSASEQNVPRAMGAIALGTTNLRTMGAQLKASYTTLRPSFANLPHVQPALLNQMALRSERAATIGGATKADRTCGSTKQLAPLKSVPAVSAIGTQRTLSALPRPISAIPKPTSKIPGPRPFRPSTTKPLTNLYYSSNTMR